jgi:hypothetical protein
MFLFCLATDQRVTGINLHDQKSESRYFFLKMKIILILFFIANNQGVVTLIPLPHLLSLWQFLLLTAIMRGVFHQPVVASPLYITELLKGYSWLLLARLHKPD